jgi:hypothetical protein
MSAITAAVISRQSRCQNKLATILAVHLLLLAHVSTCLQVLLQLLCVKSDPGYSGEPDEPQQPLTSAAAASAAEELLSSADVVHLLDDELLQNR